MRAGPLAALLMALLAALPAAAQEEGQDLPALTLDLEEVAELESLSDVKAGEAMALMGRVNLNIKGVFRLRAQRAVVW
ncbi:MAG: hypothetical protein ACYSX0_03595, partial [Planctomycetota bacterium]